MNVLILSAEPETSTADFKDEIQRALALLLAICDVQKFNILVLLKKDDKQNKQRTKKAKSKSGKKKSKQTEIRDNKERIRRKTFL